MNKNSKKITILIALFFLCSQIAPASLFAEGAVVSGVIQKITSLGGGQFELVVKEEKGASKYIVDSSTLIQAITPAKNVKVGDEILPVPRPGVAGAAGTRKTTPFKNMPPAVREALGLPNIPDIPAVPNVPNVPKVPQTPQVPKAAQTAASVPKVPQVPQAPQVPGKPAPSQPAAGGAAPQASQGGTQTPMGGGQQGGMPGGAGEESGEMGVPAGGTGTQAPGGEAKRSAQEPETVEPPREARSSTLKPQAVSEATPTLEKIRGQKILSLKKTKEGIQVEFVNDKGAKEKDILSPEEAVLVMLSTKDLKKNMSVKLEVVQDKKGNFVQRVTIV